MLRSLTAYMLMKRQKYAFPALFREEENGWYTVNFPDLDDCFTAGKGIPQALKRAKNILESVLYDYEKREIQVPNPTPIKEISCGENEFTSYLLGSTKKYWKKYKGKTRIVHYELDLSKPLPPLTKKQKKMIEEMNERPIQYDKDCPPQTEEQLREMVRAVNKNATKE